MFFRDVVGQEAVGRRLAAEVREGRVPHARLLCGPEGVGKLPLAIAYARYLCCTHRSEEESCGTCPSCVKFDRLAHPDLHFVFPVIRKRGEAVSDDYLREWRGLLTTEPYFGLNRWLEAMGAENQQAMIYERESGEIVRKLSLKSYEGGYKVVIVWLPERMHPACANKLLKLLEEPPAQTVFLLVTEKAEALLPTIVSRTQRLDLPRMGEREMASALASRCGLDAEAAGEVARMAGGCWGKALVALRLSDERSLFFELFVSLMRLAYGRKVKELREWSEQAAGLGRERQRGFLEYSQRMVRESFMINFHIDDLVCLNHEERNFTGRFAPFINERNAIGIMNELGEAQRHIEQNVNARMVMFDFALKMIMLLKT